MFWVNFLPVFTFGLVAGSFLSALTWRIPRGIDIWVDRSRCDNCNTKINWYDNIPLFSYLVLGGKCRNCGTKISIRYPLLELITGLLFLAIYAFGLPFVYYPLLTILVGIFVIDMEHQIIPDELIFIFLLISLLSILNNTGINFYANILSGLMAALFLLLINFATKGRGMGLGDVKLVLAGGVCLGYPNTITWLFLSFIIGSVIGVILIMVNKAKFGMRIAFGPFLVISFIIVMFWGDNISKLLVPYLF